MIPNYITSSNISKLMHIMPHSDHVDGSCGIISLVMEGLGVH
jgi:hypothetical protein